MRKRILTFVLAALLLCSGCAGEDKNYRVETEVWIPVNPTEAPTENPAENPTEVPAIKEETSPAETVEPTEAAEKPESTKKPSSTGSVSGGYGSNNRKPSSGKNNTASKETEPKETKPKETEPEETEPEKTKPKETMPQATETPETEPPATEAEKSGYDISGYAVGSLEYAIRDQINGARGENSLPEFGMDNRLCAIAGCRAYELAQLWSHTRPDGRSFATVLVDYGYGAGTVTELLVYGSGSGDAAQMVSQWLASESHKANLLSDGFSTVGIGVYRTNGITYVCCLLVG